MTSPERGVLEFERPVVDLERRIAELRGRAGDPDLSAEIEALTVELERLRETIVASLTDWQRVQLSRHPLRPYTLDYLERLVDEFTELHGDRRFGDDQAIVAGLGRLRALGGRPVAVIGHQKGRNTKENLVRRFGMPAPEGYRKALRVMELAARQRLPIVTLIDTPGAYPGIGAEERGQSEAIAVNLLRMARLPVPIVASVIGEGGSGGALAVGVADRILMFEYATYSVISPEGCASILWRDASRAPDAAAAMRITAPRIAALGIADEVVREPRGGAHRDPDGAAAALGEAIARHLGELAPLAPADLLERRYRKLRAMGVFQSE